MAGESDKRTAAQPPGLALALAPEALKAALATRLGREGGKPSEIKELRVLQAGTSLLYQAWLVGPDGESVRQVYSGRLVPVDRWDEEHRAALEFARVPPRLGRAVIGIREAGLLLIAYPNDPRIRLLSESEIRTWSSRHVAEIPGASGTWRVAEASLEVLRYVPGSRWTARCRVRLEDGGASEREVRFVAKQFKRPDRAKRLAQHLRQLAHAWADGPSTNGLGAAVAPTPIRFPRLIGTDEERAAVYLEELEGRNLEAVIREVELDGLMPAAGALLAQFHRGRAGIEKTVAPRSEQEDLRDALQVIAAAFPELKPRLQRWARAWRLLQPQPEVTDALLHGSFRLNHLVFDGVGLSVLDLESLRLGPPAYDIANWIASLYYLESQGRLMGDQRVAIARGLLEGYAAHSAWRIPPAEVLWFLAGLLIHKQARKYATRYHEKREEKVERMLALAEDALTRLRRLPAPTDLAGAWNVLP